MCIFFFDITLKLKAIISLKVTGNVETETKSMNFLFCYIITYWSILHFELIFICAWFCDIIHYSFRKYWVMQILLIYFNIKQQKDYLRKHYHWFYQKILSTGKQSRPRWYTQIFLNSNFHLKAWIFFFSNKYQQPFSLKCLACLLHFQENICHIPKSE